MSTSRAPRIGVTTYQENASWRGWHRSASLVPRDFLSPLADAGALPLMLPPDGGPAEAADLAAWLDGLLLVGGPDVDPARYGARREEHTGGAERKRDEWELALLAAALDAGIPVLGVCRGMQLLNVVRGGTLRQDIGKTDHQPEGSRFGSVVVTMVEDLMPGALIGPSTTVSCYHHQAVDVLGAGLVATGRSADGTVESLQLTDRDFVVGVQWHPEVGGDQSLFKAFATAAAGRVPC
ncbi:gamma-glutamyl-gamma-aminobutyrate hydrolase family protein [Umezawaea tangerina]|uniref:Putative glutamine amidotransferase n=1 Tax=Umezawaea tangerina TaxID=84725 RepID=A0A2T0SZL4_9PSEU|nr:gamma-glutamyl-gamma-aminobutyrate hydrolase family protein [Umezawaea tangerina]PRY38862.1 putative glutamine amidotransferase [Umezawaea tangerina]